MSTLSTQWSCYVLHGMKMKVDFLKYLVIEVHRNTAKALALIDKRLVKKNSSCITRCFQRRDSTRNRKSKRTGGMQMVNYMELEFSIMEQRASQFFSQLYFSIHKNISRTTVWEIYFICPALYQFSITDRGPVWDGVFDGDIYEHVSLYN